MTALPLIHLQCDGPDDDTDCPRVDEVETGYEAEFLARDFAKRTFGWDSPDRDTDRCPACTASATQAAAGGAA